MVGPRLVGGRGPARLLLPLVLPALLIGIGSSLLLIGVDWVAGRLEDLLWHVLPRVAGFSGGSWWWTLAILTATGLVVGLVVLFVPGHAGPDPATEGLIGPPVPVSVVPSMLLASAFGLAGGVSLGPENPITAANVALACFAGRRLAPRSEPSIWLALAVGGTVGALFGTPVAAALLLSEALPANTPGQAKAKLALWDRLFPPLVAAAAGALTTRAFEAPTFRVDLTPYPGFQLADLVSGPVIGVVAVAVGLAAVYAFPLAHRVFHSIRNPVLMLTSVGLVLGVLGIIGGQITLFKGLDQMAELADNVSHYSAGGLALIVVVKLAALLIAATGGFRGGRIFPAVFIGVAIGLLANMVVPEIPQSLAVASGVLGLLTAITRSGWLSLFVATTVAGDIELLPVLCIVILPVWLLATGRPQMQLSPVEVAGRH